MSDAWLLAGVAIATACLAAMLRRSSLARRLADLPNERSLHDRPMPRVGGVAMMLVALPVAAWHADAALGVTLGCAAALALISALDDVRSLPIAIRLPAHGLAAFIAFLAFARGAGIESPQAWVEALLASAVIAWMTNLFNFMDGSDGLAGGMAAFGFGAMALAAAQAGSEPLAFACAALACAALGFLTQNFPPARLFMGDAGSIPCGFLAGALGAAGWLQGAWPMWFPALVFAPFIADGSVTLVRRMLRGERFWRAHREHAYQRLVLGGWSKRKVALSAYALMLATAASALAARPQEAMVQCVIISGWAVILGLLLLAIERVRAITTNR